MIIGVVIGHPESVLSQVLHLLDLLLLARVGRGGGIFLVMMLYFHTASLLINVVQKCGKTHRLYDKVPSLVTSHDRKHLGLYSNINFVKF